MASEFPETSLALWERIDSGKLAPDMKEERSTVKRVEEGIDDLLDIWRRRPIVCVIVAVVITVPTCFALFLQYREVPRLKNERKAAREKAQDLQNKLQETERARDKAQIQLAPFLAAANQRFPDKPSEQRLEFLLSKLSEAVGSVQEAARKISPERGLTLAVRKAVTEKLKSVAPWKVKVECQVGDAEAYILAEEIKSIFEESGWKPDGVIQAVFRVPQKGLLFMLADKPPAELEQPLTDILGALGYPKLLFKDSRLDKETLRIIVGAK